MGHHSSRRSLHREIDRSVVVEVIAAEIDAQAVVGRIAGIDHHLLGILVLPLSRICSIETFLLGQSNGADYIETGRKDAIRLADEEIACRACRAVIRKAFLVELARIAQTVMTGLELDILEFDQDDKPTHVAHGGEVGDASDVVALCRLWCRLGTGDKGGTPRIQHLLRSRVRPSEVTNQCACSSPT